MGRKRIVVFLLVARTILTAGKFWCTVVTNPLGWRAEP